MQINSLWKLITCQGLGAAVLGNWKNRKCVFWREVIDTRAVKKLLLLAKKLKHRCPASSCIPEIGGKPGCIGWERLWELGDGRHSDECLLGHGGCSRECWCGDLGSELEGFLFSCHSDDITWS